MLSIFVGHSFACTIIILGVLLFINRVISNIFRSICKVFIAFFNRNKRDEEEDYDD